MEGRNVELALVSDDMFLYRKYSEETTKMIVRTNKGVWQSWKATIKATIICISYPSNEQPEIENEVKKYCFMYIKNNKSFKEINLTQEI